MVLERKLFKKLLIDWKNFCNKRLCEQTIPPEMGKNDGKIPPLNNRLSEESRIDNLVEKLSLEISLRTQRQIDIALLHQKVFPQFKGINTNKDVILVATGPSSSRFKTSKFGEAVYVGVNKAYLLKEIKFDYLFAIDRVSLEGCFEDFFSYDCIKFIGDQNLGFFHQIPENYLNRKDIFRYKTTANLLPDIFSQDLDSVPLANSCSVAIQAMQFILYTNPKRIFIVGNDCTVSEPSHFYKESGLFFECLKNRNEDLIENEKNLIQSWQAIKIFANNYYPLTKLVSVNPVKLAGLFEDVYL